VLFMAGISREKSAGILIGMAGLSQIARRLGLARWQAANCGAILQALNPFQAERDGTI
jgi:hypothetical protein